MANIMESTHCALDPSLAVEREFCIRRNGSWAEYPLVEPSSLEAAREEINKAKKQISEICEDDDGLRKWRLHTKNTHPLAAAPKLLREKYNCQGTSQAYCKFLEILRRYPLVRPNEIQLRSFHLCEAPGHFISSLDRFLCTFYPKKDWQWEANSFNPHHEGTSACDMLLEDDLILRHPDHWHFGRDGSGDVRKWGPGYVQSLTCGGCYDIVTADGSLYTQDNPEEQESVILPLLQAELAAAMGLLSGFGSLVVKIYTIYLQNTRLLIQKTASFFDDVYVFKPMSSKGGNSERYLVCLGFNGSSTPESNGKEVENTLIKCEIFFSKLQCSSIKANLATYCAISKEELNIYHDRILSEFQKRILAKYIAHPTRESRLNQEKVGRPWVDMFGKNYVETLKHVSDERSALEQLRNFDQEDVMNEHEGEDANMTEIEFSAEELDFLDWEERRLIKEKVVVMSSVKGILHSLFAPPILLRCLHYWKPEAIIDLCASFAAHSKEPSHYASSLLMHGELVLDASKLRGFTDWSLVLKSVLAGVRIVWSELSIPFILSRLSASVICLLCVMFFQMRLGDKIGSIVFEKPNYSEDIPESLESYLSLLHNLNNSTVQEEICCFVPLPMLAMFHPMFLNFNRQQWRKLLDSLKLGSVGLHNFCNWASIA